ncbi:Rrf2 family transcriptional regulator [bacterium]|nr:Rrf2 family transcriptional regulator [bacterium]MBU1072690.1 Rrf2 family transcriptional regulator [bacterium]MBU1677146.1 Rrf2 family transcriptional regulator [bacterium]
MLTLAANYDEGLMAAEQIARAQKLSLKYLESLLSSLKAAGLIVSKLGTRGGYTLSRSPTEISLFDILIPLEETLDIVRCTEDGDDCDRNGICSTQQVWKEIRDAVEDMLRKTTLADLLEKQKILDQIGGSVGTTGSESSR